MSKAMPDESTTAPKERAPEPQSSSQVESLRLRELLVDRITGLPTVPLILEDIRGMLADHDRVGLVVLDIAKYGDVERIYGWELFDETLRLIARFLKEYLKNHLRSTDQIAINRTYGDVFLIFLSGPRSGERFLESSLRNVARRLQAHMSQELKKVMYPRIRDKFGFYTGYSFVLNEPHVRLERRVYRAMKEAAALALSREEQDLRERVQRLRQIIKKGQIRPVFHPIVSFVDGGILGYEVLSRGPRGTKYESPAVLFKLAKTAGLSIELDEMCIRAALQKICTVETEAHLFLNNEPQRIQNVDFEKSSIFDPALVPNPEKVVLEITERTAIDDLGLFREALKYYKSHGFKIAIDDAGSGYSGLQTLVELSPDFIKIDMVLIHGIDRDPIKQKLITTLLEFSDSIDCTIVAEGIETMEEYHTLREIGVKYGQGFLFAIPEEEPIPPERLRVRPDPTVPAP